MKKGWVPLKFWLRGGMALAAACLLTACGGKEKPPATSWVTIDSAPEKGASVVLNGEEKGVTPLVIEDMPEGPLDILLHREGYKDASQTVTVLPNQAQTFTLDMTPLQGFLFLDSDPIGAEVRLDGAAEPAGKTPFYNYALAIGKHSYEVKLENYYPESKELDVQTDYQYREKYVLRPMEATLTILSRPSGAAIRVNNQPQGDETPLRIPLAPGDYLISAEAKGFVQTDEKISLAANETRSITLELKMGDVPEGMVLVPAGEFLRGGRSPDELPQTKVFVDAFFIDKYEVTNAQFKKVYPSHSFPAAQSDRPATGVSWNQAREYAAAIGKRLPTEVEWEKAARGEEGREFPWGNEFDPLAANTKESGVGEPAAVGKYLRGMSPYGCMDMAGNVSEWNSDWYEAYPGNPAVATDYGQKFRVIRGGSFKMDQFEARCARRHFDRMDVGKDDYGFRCAKDVSAVKK